MLVTKGYLEELDAYENEQIAAFRKTKVLCSLDKLTVEQLKTLLLQRRLVSLQFTSMYDRALSGVRNKRLESAIKWLIKEEYPLDELNHRKALVLDLERLGISHVTVLNTKPTKATAEMLQGLHDLFLWDDNDTPDSYDLKALLVLRITMEVLVSEEYEIIIAECVRRKIGLTEENSVFYVPHRDHDRKSVSLSAPLRDAKNHSEVIGACLKELVKSKAMLDLAKKTIERSVRVKASFYKQFE